MRSKFVVAALSGLFMAGVACAQSVPAPAPAAPAADPQNILNLDLSTGGRVKVLLRPDKAPYSVDRVKTLVRRHFYDGLIFHRVIEGFMAQGGDPKGTGEGGSDLPDLKAEFNDLPHVRGTMSLARAEGLDSANSQFFIMLQPNLNLDGNYTAIGRVIEGMQYADAIAKGEPPEHPSKIVHATIESDDEGQPPVAFVPPPPKAAPVVTAADAKQARRAKEADAKHAKRHAKDTRKEEAAKAKEAAKKKKEDASEAKDDAAQQNRELKKAKIAPGVAAPAPVEAVPPPPAPEAAATAPVAPEMTKAEKKQQAKLAKEQAKQAKAEADKKARDDAQQAKAAEEQAKKDAKAAKKAAKTPAPAPQALAAPSSTDQAVQAVTQPPATDAAVQSVAPDETVAQPH